MTWKIGGLALTLLSGWTFAASPAEACTPLRIALDGDAEEAVVIECPDPPETTKVCVGNSLCVNATGDVYLYPVDGKCPREHFSVKAVGSVTEACTAAKSLTPEPDACRKGCVDQDVQTTSDRDDPCCRVTKTRICSPPPPPPTPHQDAEEAVARL